MNIRETEFRKTLFISGPSGTGKSSVGAATAVRLGWPFVDADKHHTKAARDMINRGENVGEQYREAWLDRVIGATGELLSRGHNVIVACSALRVTHRQKLISYATELGEGANIMVAWLQVSEGELRRRLMLRDKQGGHFATVKLLDSQLEVMQVPAPDEVNVRVVAGEGLSVCETARLVWQSVPELHALNCWTCRVPQQPS